MHWARHYTSESVELGNAFCLRQPIELSLPVGRVAVDSTTPFVGAGFVRRLRFSADEATGTVLMNTAASEILLGGMSWAAMSADLTRLYATDRLAKLRFTGSKTLGSVRIESIEAVEPVDDVNTANAAKDDVATSLALTGTEARMALTGNRQLGMRLLALLAQQPRRDVVASSARVDLHIQLGAQKLSPTQVNRLSAGQVVLVVRALADNQPAKFEIGVFAVQVVGAVAGKILFVGKWSEQSVRVEKLVNGGVVSGQTTVGMENEKSFSSNGSTISDQPASDNSPPLGARHDLSLTFRLDSVPIRLSDLASLSAGYVFETTSLTTDASVSIYLGESRLGAGKIVTVGERIGIEVTDWNQTDV